MLEINTHKFFLVQILKDIYADLELANSLVFKGGTALMLFYDLPRFSTDLDFNLIDPDKSQSVYDKIRNILSKYGRIKDEAKKYFSLLIVLDYGQKERNLKVEISKRESTDRSEIKNFLGIPVVVMHLADMFAHKICALLDRDMLTNRDVFDCYYLMQRRTPINTEIVEKRMKTNFASYLEKCIEAIEKVNEKRMLDGLGELMDDETKRFVKSKLKNEAISLLRIYIEFPIISC